jgi:leader peptidase (prepilin peptidase)/N-methyltransferase
MQASIWGGVAGYLSLWSIFHLFKLLTGKEGMGHGDFKLLAALGAWFGIGALLPIVLLSSVVGSVVGVSLLLARRAEWSSKIPFGPYIAGAGWIYLIWGVSIRQLMGSGFH